LRSLGLAWNTKGLWGFYLKMGSMVVGFSGDGLLSEWCLDSLDILVVVDGTNFQYMKTYIVTHLLGQR
jgi:hypothetical protein